MLTVTFILSLIAVGLGVLSLLPNVNEKPALSVAVILLGVAVMVAGR